MLSENPMLSELRKKAMKLPLSPGVYIMKNSKGEIIYIGKAKALKNRVSQYFGSQNKHSLKVLKMVSNVRDFDYILVGSEFEALVLECSLIKQHMPKYNILLKDDKGYNYIKVTNGKWRRISAVLQKSEDDARYIGPYTGSYHVRQAVDEACAVFKLPQCSKVFPRDIGKGRPCLNYFISKCSAPCAGKISLEEYEQSVDAALDFIIGGAGETLKKLTMEMERLSERLEFERAAKLRDTIIGIKRVVEKQHVVSQKVKQQDVFAAATAIDKVCINVMRFNEGRLFDTEFYIFDETEDIQYLRSRFLTAYYEKTEPIPPRISVDGEVEDSALIEKLLSERAGKSVHIVCPERGEQAQLISMCRANAEEKLAQSRGRASKRESALDELATLLGLERAPEYIEAYDISHTAGADNVAGMIVYKDGRPYKKAYRRFGIKGFEGQDDYASMNEVLRRRFEEFRQSEGRSEGFGRLPDLILLDGGIGQVNAVRPLLEEFSLKIPLFGMVKDSKHRTRAIAHDGGEIAIDSKRRAFTLVSEIQEEVHRFSVEYHRQKHKKSNLSMTLLKIDGIGEKKARALLLHFKTLSAIAQASEEELSAVKGIGKSDAQRISQFFKDRG